MAITTYTELQTAISDRLARSDFTATVLQECIALAEADMQRTLRTLDMETRYLTFPMDAEYVDVPADFLSVRTFRRDGSPPVELQFMADDTMTTTYQGVTGPPRYFNVTGGKFRFAPPGDGSAATLVYYAKIPALSTSQTTNWLLTAHPDAYLYGALLQAAIRLQDTEKMQFYGGVYGAALKSIKAHTDGNRWGGPGMAMRAA